MSEQPKIKVWPNKRASRDGHEMWEAVVVFPVNEPRQPAGQAKERESNMTSTAKPQRGPTVRCGAFNQHLEVCLQPATKLCTDDIGRQWLACDAPRHDTKIGSRNVKVEILE